MLSGLMSLWTVPFSYASSSDRATCAAMRGYRAGSIGPASSASSTVSPSTWRMTRKKKTPSVPESSSGTV